MTIKKDRSMGVGVRLPRLGLIVPSIEDGGGVPTAARFLADAAIRSAQFSLSVISLSTSARDPVSMRLASPQSWVQGATTREGEWNGHPFIHVGAFLGEVEFMRYRPRVELADAIAKCDLLQVMCGFPAWANALTGYGKPISLQCATLAVAERRARDNQPRTAGDYWRRGMTSITNRLDDRALISVQAIQVMNPWMLNYVRDLNAQRNVDIRYAPPGIDERVFHPVSIRDLQSDPYILCVGRAGDPRKNIDLLLRAYAQLELPLRDRVRLVIAGSSQPSPGFWEMAKLLGVGERVVFEHRPSRLELVALYQSATVFALPSDEEGLGIVLLEAMGCGVPVISTRSGGPDGIIEDGIDGFLVDLGDASALATRLSQLLHDPVLNNAMGNAGRLKIERTYSEEVTGRVFIDVWNDLLKGSIR